MGRWRGWARRPRGPSGTPARSHLRSLAERSPDLESSGRNRGITASCLGAVQSARSSGPGRGQGRYGNVRLQQSPPLPAETVRSLVLAKGTVQVLPRPGKEVFSPWRSRAGWCTRLVAKGVRSESHGVRREVIPVCTPIPLRSGDPQTKYDAGNKG